MRIAIMDFQAKGVSKTIANNVSELIRGEMIDIGRYIVVERAQMDEILKEHEIQQTGCTDTACAVRAGKLLSARKILLGTVMKMGDVLLITGRIIDVEKGVGEFSERQEASSEGDLVRAMSLFTRKLASKIDRKTVKPEKEVTPVYVHGKYKYHIDAGYSYITPFGDFKDLADTGMGGTLNVSMDIIRAS